MVRGVFQRWDRAPWSALNIYDVFPSIDFRRRFLKLLSFNFREFSSVMGLSVLEAANAGVKYPKCDRIPG
jgi:hypothetical protein